MNNFALFTGFIKIFRTIHFLLWRKELCINNQRLALIMACKLWQREVCYLELGHCSYCFIASLFCLTTGRPNDKKKHNPSNKCENNFSALLWDFVAASIYKKMIYKTTRSKDAPHLAIFVSFNFQQIITGDTSDSYGCLALKNRRVHYTTHQPRLQLNLIRFTQKLLKEARQHCLWQRNDGTAVKCKLIICMTQTTL